MRDSKTIIIGLLLTPFAAVWDGWILRLLWHWFVSPVFGIRDLRIPEAIGITIITHYLASSPRKSDKGLMVAMLDAILGSLFILVVGWIVHFFL